jgi:hypothetical protein
MKGLVIYDQMLVDKEITTWIYDLMMRSQAPW